MTRTPRARVIRRLADFLALSIACALLASAPAAAQSTRARGKAPAAVAGPADYRSQHFLIHTDLAAAEAKELLTRLETMLGLISAYWGKAPQGIIECYVVQDLARWPADALDPRGRQFIAAGAGLTVTQSLVTGNSGYAKSVVYATADRGTPQHESVHAYCGQNFGTAGPVWYAEGMAEMGQYWRKGDASVNCRQEVVEYLRGRQPKSLNEIVNARESSGDSWQNYAWRWALCHLLANNPNYAAKFRPLGLALLTRQRTSFEQVYGDVADELSFEYRFFVAHVARGYRVDLCSWDWKRKFLPIHGDATLASRVQAGRGWQPSGAAVVAGETYQYSASGNWQTAANADPVDADGASTGRGRLVGVLMKDFELGESFDLGTSGTWTAPEDGRLYLRCRDDWHALADNKGSLNVKLKLARP